MEVIRTIVVKVDTKPMEDKAGKETGVMTEMEEINLENQSILLIKMGSDSCAHPVVPTGTCYRIVKIHGRT